MRRIFAPLGQDQDQGHEHEREHAQCELGVRIRHRARLRHDRCIEAADRAVIGEQRLHGDARAHGVRSENLLVETVAPGEQRDERGGRERAAELQRQAVERGRLGHDVERQRAQNRDRQRREHARQPDAAHDRRTD